MRGGTPFSGQCTDRGTVPPVVSTGGTVPLSNRQNTVSWEIGSINSQVRVILSLCSVLLVENFLFRGFGTGNDRVCLLAAVLGLALELGHRGDCVAFPHLGPVRPGHAFFRHITHLTGSLPGRRRKDTGAKVKHRTPTGELLKNEAFRQALSKLTGQVCNDVRITARVYGYVKANNEDLSKEETKELMKDIYAETRKGVFDMAIDQLRADAGYLEQAQADVVTNLLIRLLGDASRSRGQRQAQRDLLRHRELSKTAQRDRKVQQEQAGSWPGPEL